VTHRVLWFQLAWLVATTCALLMTLHSCWRQAISHPHKHTHPHTKTHIQIHIHCHKHTQAALQLVAHLVLWFQLAWLVATTCAPLMTLHSCWRQAISQSKPHNNKPKTHTNTHTLSQAHTSSTAACGAPCAVVSACVVGGDDVCAADDTAFMLASGDFTPTQKQTHTQKHIKTHIHSLKQPQAALKLVTHRVLWFQLAWLVATTCAPLMTLHSCWRQAISQSKPHNHKPKTHTNTHTLSQAHTSSTAACGAPCAVVSACVVGGDDVCAADDTAFMLASGDFTHRNTTTSSCAACGSPCPSSVVVIDAVACTVVSCRRRRDWLVVGAGEWEMNDCCSLRPTEGGRSLSDPSA